MPKQTVNPWKELHTFFDRKSITPETNKAIILREAIMKNCGWSLRTFYRKMDSPQTCSIAEKLQIAQLYDLPPHFLFPEMKLQAA